MTSETIIERMFGMWVSDNKLNAYKYTNTHVYTFGYRENTEIVEGEKIVATTEIVNAQMEIMMRCIVVDVIKRNWNKNKNHTTDDIRE